MPHPDERSAEKSPEFNPQAPDSTKDSPDGGESAARMPDSLHRDAYDPKSLAAYPPPEKSKTAAESCLPSVHFGEDKLGKQSRIERIVDPKTGTTEIKATYADKTEQHIKFNDQGHPVEFTQQDGKSSFSVSFENGKVVDFKVNGQKLSGPQDEIERLKQSAESIIRNLPQSAPHEQASTLEDFTPTEPRTGKLATGTLVWEDNAGYHQSRVEAGQIKDANGKAIGSFQDNGQIKFDQGTTTRIANQEGWAFHGVGSDNSRLDLVSRTSSRGFNGIFGTLDGKEGFAVVGGHMYDRDGKFIGHLDASGKVTFEQSDPKTVRHPLDANNFCTRWVFQGKENNHSRTFVTYPQMVSGDLNMPQDAKLDPAVTPGNQGKQLDYKIHLNMLLNSKGEQIGLIQPPSEANGKLDGGTIIFTNTKPPKEVSLCELKGAVFKLDTLGEPINKSRTLVGVCLGKQELMANGMPKPGVGGLFNIQEALDVQKQRKDIADERKSQQGEFWNQVTGVFGETAKVEAQAATARAQADGIIKQLNNITTTGQVSQDTMNVLSKATTESKTANMGDPLIAKKQALDSAPANLESLPAQPSKLSGYVIMSDDKGNHTKYSIAGGKIIDSQSKSVGSINGSNGTFSLINPKTGKSETNMMAASVGAVWHLLYKDNKGSTQTLDWVSLGSQNGGIASMSDLRNKAQHELAYARYASERNPTDETRGAITLTEIRQKQLLQRLEKITQGGANPGDIAYLASGPQKTVRADMYKQQELPEPKKIELPVITDALAKSMNGRMRIGSDCYTIKNGNLYSTSDSTNSTSGKQAPSGKFLGGYIVQLDGKGVVNLATESRVVLEFRCGNDKSTHQIIGFGASRINENGERISGGLVDKNELLRQARQASSQSATARNEFVKNQSVVTGSLANWTIGDPKAILERQTTTTNQTIGAIQAKLNQVFARGFDSNKFYNDQLDRTASATQALVKICNLAAADSSDLSQTAQSWQRMTDEIGTMAAMTVLTCGTGALVTGAANTGKLAMLGRAGVVGLRVASCASVGAVVSAGMRQTTNGGVEQFVGNLGSGAIQGTLMSGIGVAQSFNEASALAKTYNLTKWAQLQELAAEAKAVASTTDGVAKAARLEQAAANPLGKLAIETAANPYQHLAVKAAVNLGEPVVQSVGWSLSSLPNNRAKINEVLDPRYQMMTAGSMLLAHKLGGLGSTITSSALKKVAVDELTISRATNMVSSTANAGGFGAINSAWGSVDEQSRNIGAQYGFKQVSNKLLGEKFNYGQFAQDVLKGGATNALMFAPASPFISRFSQWAARQRVSGSPPAEAPHTQAAEGETPPPLPKPESIQAATASGDTPVNDTLSDTVAKLQAASGSSEKKSEQFDALNKQLQANGLTPERLAAICTKDNLFRETRLQNYYKIPGMPDYTVGVRKGAKLSSIGEPQPVGDGAREDLGLPIARLGHSVNIEKIQDGELVGSPTSTLFQPCDPPDKYIEQSRQLAEMPQEAYSKLSRQLIDLNNSNNSGWYNDPPGVLVNWHTQEFKPADVDHCAKNETSRHGLGDMVISLTRGCTDNNIPDSAEIIAIRQQIIKKCVQACEQTGLPMNIRDDYHLLDRWRLAKLPDAELLSLMNAEEKRSGQTLSPMSEVLPKPDSPVAPVDTGAHLNTDGRPSNNSVKDTVTREFPQFNRKERVAARKIAEDDLAGSTAVMSRRDEKCNIKELLLSDPRLTDQQKARILDTLAEVRQRLATPTRAGETIETGNSEWQHIQSRLAAVLDIAQSKHYSRNNLEDTLLASAFADSQGRAFDCLGSRKDRALIASELLGREQFDPSRIKNVVQIIHNDLLSEVPVEIPQNRSFAPLEKPSASPSAVRQLKAFRLPEATGATFKLGGGSTQTPWVFGDMIKSAGGSVTVVDHTSGSSRTFDNQGLLNEASIAGITQKYSYSKTGDLIKVEEIKGDDRQILEKQGNKWVQRRINAFGTAIWRAEDQRDREVDPDGGLVEKIVENNAVRFRHHLLNGHWEEHDARGSVQYGSSTSATYETEKNTLYERAKRLMNDRQAKQFAALQKDYDSLSANDDDPHFHDRLGGGLYRQLNRLLTAPATGDLPLSERIKLAVNILRNAGGASSLPQNNYEKAANVTLDDCREFPARTAQTLVDLALTGKHINESGKVIDATYLLKGVTADTGSESQVNSDSTKPILPYGGTEKIYPDGRRELVYPSGRIEYKQANYDVEKARLGELAETAFADKRRSQIFEAQRELFEKQAELRGITKGDQALFYQQLNRLIGQAPEANFTLQERADLAQQVLNHAIHPETTDQGHNKTCNVSTLEHRLYWRQPDVNSKTVADIALTGKYITTRGIVIDITKLPSGLKPDWQSKASLELQQKTGGLSVKYDGGRDWASQIVQSVMVNSHWGGASPIISGDRILNDESGAKQEIGFNDNGNLVKFGKNGQEIDLYDSFGKPLNSNLDRGEVGFDIFGKALVTCARPGEIIYDKLPTGTNTGEYVSYKGIRLRNSQGEFIKSPEIELRFLEHIEADFAGQFSKPFVIDSAADADDLGQRILELKDEHSLPGVLLVYAVHPPFNELQFFDKCFLEEGAGCHVINPHDYDPVTRKVKLTNQWGSKHDYLENGIPVEVLFNAMQRPQDAPLTKIFKQIKNVGKTGN